MIRPPGHHGVVFTEASDGDQRSSDLAREKVCEVIGISSSWATVGQVHGNRVVQVDGPGVAGGADAMWTVEVGLPLAVYTADCFGLALVADEAVGVAHAGWRGVDSAVVAALLNELERAGHRPHAAAVGPGIGPCCFEVGQDVAARFEPFVDKTTWGTVSVNLVAALSEQVAGLKMWSADGCTRHEPNLFSHRRNATSQRLATIAWLP